MRYSVDLDRLESVTDDMAAFERTLVRHLADLDRLIASLHETWVGDAAEAQRQAHERWRRGAEEMREALVQMRQAALDAHQNYSSAVNANQATWAQVS